MNDQVTKRAKYFLTASACFGYTVFGLGFSVFGPTLIDIADLVGSSVEAVSYGFVIRALVYCFGALFCGWLFSRFDRQKGLGWSFVILGLSVLVVPLLTSLAGFLLSQAAFGFAGAAMEVAANALIPELWKMDANPYMQLMHFCYAFGSIFGPLIAEPFLSPDRYRRLENITLTAPSPIAEGLVLLQNELDSVINTTISETINETMGEDEMIDHHLNKHPNVTLIIIPYTIAAAFFFFAAIFQFYLCFRIPFKSSESRTVDKRQSEKDCIDKEANAELNIKEKNLEVGTVLEPVWTLPKSYWISVIGAGAILLCFDGGLELNTFNYLQTFAVNVELKLSKRKGALMTAVLNGSFTLSRFLSIFVATFMSAKTMILIDLIIIMIGNVILIFYSHTSEVGLWIGVIVLGFGFSSCWPCVFAFIEERISVTNFISGLFLFATQTHAAVGPLIEGHFIEMYPMVFVYINTISGAICVLMYLALDYTDSVRNRLMGRRLP